jgi:hypothetical protein
MGRPRRNRLRLEGMTELKQQLLGLPAHLADQAKPLVDRAAAAAVMAIRESIPYRSGTLKAGLTSRVLWDDAALYQVQVRNDVPYAPFVEFGTRYMSGQPTFYPETRAKRRELAAAIMRLVQAEGLTVTGSLDS